MRCTSLTTRENEIVYENGAQPHIYFLGGRSALPSLFLVGGCGCLVSKSAPAWGQRPSVQPKSASPCRAWGSLCLVRSTRLERPWIQPLSGVNYPNCNTTQVPQTEGESRSSQIIPRGQCKHDARIGKEKHTHAHT